MGKSSFWLLTAGIFLFSLLTARGQFVGPAPRGKALVAASHDGIIKGKVVFHGPSPRAMVMEALARHPDCKDCPEDQKVDQTWLVGKNGGVANAVIFLRPPPETFFALTKSQVKVVLEVTIDQPFCHYVPRVVALFPSYRDQNGTTQETGQSFRVKNSGKIVHNVAWRTPDAGSVNKLLPGGFATATEIRDFVPHRGLVPYEIGCNIHNWMRAYVWSFDHPFFAITDKDGNFEIKDVPTGADVLLFGWHEGTKVFNDKGETLKLKKGETITREFKIKQ